MNALLAPLAGSLLNVALQGVLLTLAVALALRLLPAVSAAVRSLVWGTAFLLLIGLHFVPHASSVTTHYVQPGWAMWLGAMWATASAWRTLQFAGSLVRLRSLYRRAVPLGETISVFTRSSVLLCASSEVHRPTVAGFFRPRILLPESLLAGISPEERRYVLLHEIAHLRRADNWTNLLQKLALILFPLDPALLWIERRLCREREFACDERVVAETRSPRSYAMCLTTLAERGLAARASSLALGAWQRRSELVERVEQMLRPASSASSRTWSAAAGALLCAALGLGAASIARQPQMFSFAAPAVPSMATMEDSNVTQVGGRMVLTAARLPRSASPAALQTAMRMDRKHPAPVFRQVQRRRAKARSTAQFQSTVYARRYVPRRNTPAQPAAYMQSGTFSGSSSPVFVPVTTYAVATPEGWLVITI